MKSVGEVMAIGRSFQEALQKACQSLEIGRNGLGADGKNWNNQDDILHAMKHASSDRVFRIYDAMRLGIPLKTIYEITKMDYWFLRQLEELVVLEFEIEKYHVDNVPKELILEAKMKGYACFQPTRIIKKLAGELDPCNFKIVTFHNLVTQHFGTSFVNFFTSFGLTICFYF